jgi:DNA-binding transcriptional LysR family regulator
MEPKVDTSETLGGALEDIRAFCAVIELGSISAAARETGETKGGVSRRISRLEGRLGARLLSRTPRAVTATEEGISFYTKASDALALLQDATEAAKQSRSVPSGHLRVTAPHDFGQEVLPKLIVAFRNIQPQITVELILTDSSLDLAAHRIDLALRATAGALPDTEYRASSLGSFAINLYAAPSYLAGNAALTTPEDCAAHQFVARGKHASAATPLNLQSSRGASKEVFCRPQVTASDYACVHSILKAGGGIGALPDIVAADSVSNGSLVRVLPEWTLARAQLHAMSVSGREAPARVRVFREFVRNELAQMT